MTSIKKFTTTIMLGLALALTSAAFAQTAQTDPNKQESCDMKSCCCKADTCPMKAGHKDHAKSQTAKDGGCCCCGDSCDMKMKDMKKEEKPKSN